jgi:hypothetical protein
MGSEVGVVVDLKMQVSDEVVWCSLRGQTLTTCAVYREQERREKGHNGRMSDPIHKHPAMPSTTLTPAVISMGRITVSKGRRTQQKRLGHTTKLTTFAQVAPSIEAV